MSDYGSVAGYSSDTQYADHDFGPISKVVGRISSSRQKYRGLVEEVVHIFDVVPSFATDAQVKGVSLVERLKESLKDVLPSIGPDRLVKGLVIAGDDLGRKVVLLADEHTDDAYLAAAKVQERLLRADLKEVDVSVWALQGRSAKRVAASLGTLI